MGEIWAMGNSFLKPAPVKHWQDDPQSQWQFILFMESPLDQMARLWFGGWRSERMKASDQPAFCKTPVQEDQRQFELSCG